MIKPGAGFMQHTIHVNQDLLENPKKIRKTSERSHYL